MMEQNNNIERLREKVEKELEELKNKVKTGEIENKTKLSEKNEKSTYNILLDHIEDGVYFVDKYRRIMLWNKGAEKISGYTSEEIVGRFCQDNILNHIDREGRPLCIVGCPLFDTLGDGEIRKAEVFLRHKKGHRVPVMAKIVPVYEDDEIVGAVEIFSPLSLKSYEDDLIDSLSEVAMQDQLTRLYNRNYIISYLDYKIQQFERFQELFCVIFLDIDDFADFNNKYGHSVGDDVLRTVANSFKMNSRDSDVLARWGGDEFIGVFDIENPKDVRNIANKMRALVKGSEVLVDGEHVSASASFGITLPKVGDSVASIIDRADRLMYVSKQTGKNKIEIDQGLS